jgi:dTDP-4-dehydrorhamnose reductase
MSVIDQDLAAELYDDQFVSSIDVWSFADAALDLTLGDARGVLNLAASEVFSKAELVLTLAAGLGRKLTNARKASVAGQATLRADSLGLDVSRAERMLGRAMPTLDSVVASLVGHLEERRS